MKRYLFLFTATAMLGMISCGGATEKSSSQKDTVKTDTAVKVTKPAFDPKFNDYARFISGLPANSGSSMAKYDSVKQVKEHASQFGKRWEEMEKNRQRDA